MKPPPSSPGEGGFLRFSLPYSMKSGGWPEAPIYDRAAPNAIFYIKRDMAIEILIYSRHELPKSMLPHPMNEFRDTPLPPSRCPDRSGEHNQPGKEMGVSGSRFTGTSMAPGEPQIRDRLRGRRGPCAHKNRNGRHEGYSALRCPDLSARIMRSTRLLACLFEIRADCPANLPITKPDIQA